MRTDQQVSPPPEQGKRLATFPRSGGRDGARQELRVTLATFDGHAYCALRVWIQDQEGRFWPAKNRGCSVRLSEAQGVAEALLEALRIVEDHRSEAAATGQPADPPADARPRPMGPRSWMERQGQGRAHSGEPAEPGPRRRWNPADPLPSVQNEGEAFDEF